MARFWLLYGCAICIRLALLFSPGYIHPDEFFQAQEVAAIRRHSLDQPLPWEFNCTHPCRSSMMVFTAASLPYGNPAAYMNFSGRLPLQAAADDAHDVVKSLHSLTDYWRVQHWSR